jgi:hypothetical protein
MKRGLTLSLEAGILSAMRQNAAAAATSNQEPATSNQQPATIMRIL